MSAGATGPRRTPCGRGAERQSSRTARSSWRRRAGSARTSISTIFPRLTVKPMIANGRPRGATTTPAAPFTSAGRTNGESREKVSVCSATARTPRTSLDKPARTAPPSIRSTTSGSSTASRASKSPSREAARKASTASLWQARPASAEVAAPCTRRRARLASCLAAVVEHEREPLGGSQGFEYHEQREAYRVCHERFMLGVDPVLAAYDRLGHASAQRLLAPRLARAQHVQAYPPDDRRQPSAQVLDAAGVRAAEPEPGFLDGVVGLADRAEHPVGHRPQVGAVLLEALCQPIVYIHCHIP